MSIIEILNSLENAWERDDILVKIKNGLGKDEIVNEFIKNNKKKIEELNTFLKAEDIEFLNRMEQLSNCEAKLIKEINNLNYSKNKDDYIINNEKKSLTNKLHTKKISSLMNNWSNRFVVIALLIISAIALSKQAWA